MFESNLNNCVGNSKNAKTSKNNPKGWQKHDHFTTQRHTFEVILQYIPKDKIIWMPFYANGSCGQILKELGYEVYHEPRDFFTYEPDKWDIVIDNPPYSNKKAIIDRLNSFGKPFALLLPLMTLQTKFIKPSINSNNGFSILILNNHYHHFDKIEGDIVIVNKNKSTNIITPTWFCFGMKDFISESFIYED